MNLFRACSRGRAHRRGMGSNPVHALFTWPPHQPGAPQSSASHKLRFPPHLCLYLPTSLSLYYCLSTSLEQLRQRLSHSSCGQACSPTLPWQHHCPRFLNIINPNYASSFFLFCKYFVVAHLVTWININVFNIYTPFFLERM